MGNVFRRIVTRKQVADQHAGATRLAPGIWIDRDGGLHYSVPEMLALMCVADTPANRAEVERTIVEYLQRECPQATVTLQEEES